jgi:glycosyltransferase involved in cell wall biosynthesis
MSETLALVCDLVGHAGGTERYWQTVGPELAKRYDMRIIARAIADPAAFGLVPTQIEWAGEHAPSDVRAGDAVGKALEGCTVAITSNVFDSAVLRAVRSSVPRWIARIHDHRPFCPNGDRVFPQFSGPCTAPMGAACAANSLLRGCVRGPRPSTFAQISRRVDVRDAIAGADRVLVSSEYMRRLAARNGIAPERISVTPPPLPDAAFSDALRLPPGNAVLFSGRITAGKGLQSLVRAIGRIPGSRRPRLVVAGEGDQGELDAVNAIARRLNVDVDWLGWVSGSRLHRAIDEARVVAVPSLLPEPFGLSGTEALARGRPVVAYDVGGIAEWLGDAGIAVPRADDAALARAIDALCADDTMWMRVAQAAIERAQRFRLQQHLRILADVFCAPLARCTA